MLEKKTYTIEFNEHWLIMISVLAPYICVFLTFLCEGLCYNLQPIFILLGMGIDNGQNILTPILFLWIVTHFFTKIFEMATDVGVVT